MSALCVRATEFRSFLDPHFKPRGINMSSKLLSAPANNHLHAHPLAPLGNLHLGLPGRASIYFRLSQTSFVGASRPLLKHLPRSTMVFSYQMLLFPVEKLALAVAMSLAIVAWYSLRRTAKNSSSKSLVEKDRSSQERRLGGQECSY